MNPESLHTQAPTEENRITIHDNEQSLNGQDSQQAGKTLPPPPLQLFSTDLQSEGNEGFEPDDVDMDMGGGRVGAGTPEQPENPGNPGDPGNPGNSGNGDGVIQRTPDEALKLAQQLKARKEAENTMADDADAALDSAMAMGSGEKEGLDADQEGVAKEGEMDESQRKLEATLANSGNLDEFPLLTSRNKTTKVSQTRLRVFAKEWLVNFPKPDQERIIAAWNNGVDSNHFSFLPPSNFKPGKIKVDQSVEDEVSKANPEGDSSPDMILGNLIQEILTEDWPEDFQVVLRCFFDHTANFRSESGQGKDFTNSAAGAGGYYRSEMSRIRANNSELLKQVIQQKLEEKGDSISLPTYQVINSKLREFLLVDGLTGGKGADQTIREARHFPISSGAESGSAQEGGQGSEAFKFHVSQNTHPGPLGLPSNVYKTVRTGIHAGELRKGQQGESGLDQDDDQSMDSLAMGDQIAGSEPVSEKEGLQPVSAPENLAQEGEDNYHDTLLADRANLVQKISQMIKGMYAGERKPPVRPIQADLHPSLILEIDLPDKHGKPKTQEKQLREAFIAEFNNRGSGLPLKTELTYRGSFGFPYPSASSVNGPVRIWPGLVPHDVFENLIMDALRRLIPPKAAPASQGSVPADHDGAADLGGKDRSSSQGAEATFPPPPVPFIHLEALKIAVKYAQSAAVGGLSYKGPEKALDWILQRVQKNLVTADSLLQVDPTTGSDMKNPAASSNSSGEASANSFPAASLINQEEHYLRSCVVIENLMEYSYMLESLLTEDPKAQMEQGQGQGQKKDPYPAYFNKTMEPEAPSPSGPIKSATYYTDSGMQAMVVAALIANGWRNKKGVSEGEKNPAIDVNSYFEYATIDTQHLGLDTYIRGGRSTKSVARNAMERTLAQLDAILPGIISIDLNPVFTSSEQKETAKTAPDTLAHFANKQPEGAASSSSAPEDETMSGKNDHTIPIIDITNTSLKTAADLNLGEGYNNYIVVESLSKHQQLGADKFTMGRITVVGTPEFIGLADSIAQPVHDAAYDRLPAMYRLRMDHLFFGETDDTRPQMNHEDDDGVAIDPTHHAGIPLGDDDDGAAAQYGADPENDVMSDLDQDDDGATVPQGRNPRTRRPTGGNRVSGIKRLKRPDNQLGEGLQHPLPNPGIDGSKNPK